MSEKRKLHKSMKARFGTNLSSSRVIPTGEAIEVVVWDMEDGLARIHWPNAVTQPAESMKMFVVSRVELEDSSKAA
jgi:hypothetical protein